jgi:hypothetical protein
MTEAEWLACNDLLEMLAHIADAASERRLRLYGCACCQQIESLLTDERSRRAVEVAEHFAESRARNNELEAARIEALEAIRFVAGLSHGSSYERRVAKGAAEAAAKLCGKKIHKVIVAIVTAALDSVAEAAGLVGARVGAYAVHRHSQRCASAKQFTTFLTDVVGNPFRPVSLDPAWITSDVAALARGIYDDRAFDRMPILADALQDAGCANEDVLNHCRAETVHVRGCWVVDLVLGKS